MLARRYLLGHAPAAAEDLARWAGITLADARRGLEAATAPKAAPGPGRQPETGALPAPRLLEPFDPLLLGWASRAPIVGNHKTVVTTNGVFRPVVLVRGRVAGIWSLSAGTLTINPLEPISDRHLAQLVEDGADVLRYLGLPVRPAIVRDRL
jgi:hypothetical protein